MMSVSNGIRVLGILAISVLVVLALRCTTLVEDPDSSPSDTAIAHVHVGRLTASPSGRGCIVRESILPPSACESDLGVHGQSVWYIESSESRLLSAEEHFSTSIYLPAVWNADGSKAAWIETESRYKEELDAFTHIQRIAIYCVETGTVDRQRVDQMEVTSREVMTPVRELLVWMPKTDELVMYYRGFHPNNPTQTTKGFWLIGIEDGSAKQVHEFSASSAPVGYDKVSWYNGGLLYVDDGVIRYLGLSDDSKPWLPDVDSIQRISVCPNARKLAIVEKKANQPCRLMMVDLEMRQIERVLEEDYVGLPQFDSTGRLYTAVSDTPTDWSKLVMVDDQLSVRTIGRLARGLAYRIVLTDPVILWMVSPDQNIKRLTLDDTGMPADIETLQLRE